jgi:hypothetical protein
MTTVHDPKPHHLLVAVLTTAGSFPADGFDELPEQQPIKVDLGRAAKELKITNTEGWIATVGGRELNIDASYLANQLSGKIEINYGPRETGGGVGTLP